MQIEQVHLREIHMRLRSPFETSFGTVRNRRILLVQAQCEGLSGWDESTAMEGPFFSSETIDIAWMMLCNYLVPSILGKETGQAQDIPKLPAPVRGHEIAKAALGNAVWHRESQMRGVPLSRLLGGTLEEIACGVSLRIQPTIDKMLDSVVEQPLEWDDIHHHAPLRHNWQLPFAAGAAVAAIDNG
ncbi:MAG: hypothetical protein ACR2NN_19980 [Bryobacteraceae bacterium]